MIHSCFALSISSCVITLNQSYLSPVSTSLIALTKTVCEIRIHVIECYAITCQGQVTICNDYYHDRKVCGWSQLRCTSHTCSFSHDYGWNRCKNITGRCFKINRLYNTCFVTYYSKDELKKISVASNTMIRMWLNSQMEWYNSVINVFFTTGNDAGSHPCISCSELVELTAGLTMILLNQILLQDFGIFLKEVKSELPE